MRKGFFAICSILLVLVVSIAVLVPGCTPTTGTIEVKATLCDLPWEGDVDYTLTGPGAAAPTIINGTNVTALFDNVDCGNWTCTYDGTGGPPGAYLVDITPPSPQDVTSGSTKTFTLNFEEDQDAWINIAELPWTINGVPIPGGPQYYEWEASFCDTIDVHFKQGVHGCEGRIVAVNETSRLWIHYMGFSPIPVEPLCQQVPDPVFYVYNDLCAVNKTAESPALPPEKESQMTTYWGDPIEPSPTPIPFTCCEDTELDVETIWMLEKEIDYTKSINWFGISFVEPMPHECVLFEVVIPVPVPGWYFFSLVAEAEVELMDDEDVNTQNNKATSPPLYLTVWVP